MYRQRGAIPPIKQDRYPRRLLVFDTESYRGNIVGQTEYQSFRLGVVRFIELDRDLNILNDQWSNIQDPQSLIEFTEYQTRKDNCLYVYAHNIKFDLQLSGLLTGLISRGWEVKRFTMEDPPTFIQLKRGRMSIYLVDTFNYWQTSVSAMGEQLGLPKLTMPADDVPDNEMFIYCRRDVEVLSEYLLAYFRFLSDNDLCGVGLTLASQSLRSYRHRFMTTEIILHNDPLATELERKAYSGGRVEAYKLGQLPEQDYYKLDVNSMYPYVMKEYEYPIELKGVSDNVPLERVRALSNRFYLIADCTLQTDIPAYAYKQAHKLVFPVGNYRSVLHHVELMRAINRNEIVQVHRLAIYRKAKIFANYIDFFYHQKVSAELAGNAVERHQAKIMMNSLYGKFGQSNVESSMIDNFTNHEYGRMIGYSESLGGKVEITYLGHQMQVTHKGGESAYSFPAIAGAVTAYARMYLWDLIEQAGRENVYYCDTDCIVTNQAGYALLQTLENDHQLGYLKLEGVTRSYTIYGLKDYAFGTESKHKGIPKKAQEIAPGKWQYQQARGGITWMKSGLPEGVEWYTRVKTRSGKYTKGEVLANGDILPLRLTLAQDR